MAKIAETSGLRCQKLDRYIKICKIWRSRTPCHRSIRQTHATRQTRNLQDRFALNERFQIADRVARHLKARLEMVEGAMAPGHPLVVRSDHSVLPKRPPR